MSSAHSIGMSSVHVRRQYTVTKTDHQHSVVMKYLIALLCVGFFCALFYIWSRIQIVNTGYEINREMSLKEQLIEENKRLTVEAATLKSPVRLETLAKNEYKMDLPQKNQILTRDIPVQIQVAKKPSVPVHQTQSNTVEKSATALPAVAVTNKTQKNKKELSEKQNPKVATLMGLLPEL